MKYLQARMLISTRVYYEGEFQNISAGTILELDEEYFENLEQMEIVERFDMITSVHSAIRLILADKKSYSKSLNYAVNYCEAALGMPEGSEALRIQCQYILGNITGWRHPDAKSVREFLKKASKK